jgi:ABC-type Fe3+ transport system permease subunit
VQVTSIRFRVARAALTGLILAVGLSIFPASLLDYGPQGSIRFSFFPLALTVLDPFVFTCSLDSLSTAVLSAVGAFLVGIFLARVLYPWSFRGRAFLLAMTVVPLVIPPAYQALGWMGIAEALISSRLLENGGLRAPFLREVLPVSVDDLGAWTIWVGSNLMPGVALVVLVTGDALRRIDPAWEDAARLAGVSRLRAWRRLIWPALRPNVAAAVGLVFASALVEPGSPRILGIRRSLGFQILESGTGTDATAFPRTPALALVALAGVVLGRIVVRAWAGRPARGRASWDSIDDSGHSRRNGVPLRAVDSWAAAASFWVVAGAWCLLGLAPLAGLGYLAALPGFTEVKMVDGHGNPLLRERVDGWVDPEMGALLVNTALVAVVGAVVFLTMVRLGGSDGLRDARSLPNRGASIRVGMASWPSLIFGVSVLSSVRLVTLGLASLQTEDATGVSGTWLARLADTFDPVMNPLGVLLIGVALDQMRRSLMSSRDRQRSDPQRLERAEAARLLGVGRWRARRLSLGTPWRSAWLQALLAGVFLATSVSPMIVLVSRTDARPLGPAVVEMANRPGAARSRAACLAIAACAVNLLALGLSNRRQASTTPTLIS